MSVKNAANQKAQYAIMKGLLVRQPCERCGARDVHAHHDDHRKPLEVRWLCPLHHSQADSDRRERLGVKRGQRRRRGPYQYHKELVCYVIRKRIGFTQQALAMMAGLQNADISRIECGARLSDIKTKRLARALGLRPDELTQDAQPQAAA
jgi:ribosomal protein S27AE/DNA-binding XRE family transcriptional regulator